MNDTINNDSKIRDYVDHFADTHSAQNVTLFFGDAGAAERVKHYMLDSKKYELAGAHYDEESTLYIVWGKVKC